MTAKRKWLIGLTGGLLSLLLFGFLIFAAVIMRDPKPSEVKADGIVVLTGGGQRIREAGKLLGAGRAKRLLVTGINQRTKPHQILKLSGLEKALFECCVDLGYEALDTVGNAAETHAWAREKKFTTLIVVTSNYHMPRSLAELSRKLPGATLIPHAVIPKTFSREAWWLDARTTRILVSEYLKFLPAAARLATDWVVPPWRESSYAANIGVQRAKHDQTGERGARSGAAAAQAVRH